MEGYKSGQLLPALLNISRSYSKFFILESNPFHLSWPTSRETSLLFFHLFHGYARCMHVSTLRMLELFFRAFVYICCLEFYKKSVVTNFLEIENIWFIRLKISCQNEVIIFLISLLVILAGLFGSIRNNAYLPKYQDKVIFFLLSIYWVQNDIHRWWTLSVRERTISGIRKRVRVTSLHLLYWRPLWRHPPAFSGSEEATAGCGRRTTEQQPLIPQYQ